MALAGLITVYTWVFTALAFGLHAGMRTHKADLGQIAQAVWNSSRGRFVEMTDNGFIATRMTDHVEPILAVVSPLLWVWDDVRALLWLQVALVALGAWPLYELALLLLDRTLDPAARGQVWQWEPLRRLTRPLALALALAYLLTPQLQSAVLTEFHAVPLAAPLVLWALWAVEARRWGQFAAATVLLGAVKEETALLAGGVGVWAGWRSTLVGWGDATPRRSWAGAGLGSLLALAGLAWFYVATFVIVPAHAMDVYGVAESTYFRRYGALGDSPLDIARNLVTQPGLVWAIAREPARLAYLWGLATPFGLLALAAPEVALLAGPVLLANLLSAYPAQYYGEFHYSAPVVVYFAAAAAFGLARVWRFTGARLARGSAHFQHMPAAHPAVMAAASLAHNGRTALRPLLAGALVVWLVGWAGTSYTAAGRGPGGGRYDPTPVTAHHRLLARFTAQIPRDAAVTATAAVHPHVALRRYVYQFPTGLEPPGEAEWALLDVTTATDMAPGDVRTTVEAMLAGEWGVVDAADGYLLLRKGATVRAIPPAFYDFARTRAAPTSAAPLALTGVEAADWPRWRQTRVVTSWQVGPGYDGASMAPAIELRTPGGETLYRWADAMPPALVWYPPDVWQPGDTVTATTLPLVLPAVWGVAVERTPGLVWPPAGAEVVGESAALVGAYARSQRGEVALPIRPPASAAAVFDVGDGHTFVLEAGVAQLTIRPGGVVDVHLQWTGAAWPDGAVVFVHLRQDGVNRSQQDGLPRYFVQPAPGKLVAVTDWRQLVAPDDLTPGVWTVVVGLYQPAADRRLPLLNAAGAASGDELVVATLTPVPPRVADQSCALIPATCASQVE